MIRKRKQLPKQNTSHHKYISINPTGYDEFSTSEKNAFHTYIALLSKYNNNHFINKTYQEIASLIGVSRNQLFKNLIILEKWELIDRTNKKQDLVVLPQKKVKGEHTNVIKIYRSIKVKDIQKVLFQTIVSENLNAQKWNIVTKDIISDKPQINNNDKVVSRKQLFKLTKMASKHHSKNGTKVNGVVNKKIYTSMRKISELMGVSLKQAFLLFHEMSNKNMFQYQWNFELFTEGISYDKFRELSYYYNLHSDSYIKFIYKREGGKMFIHRGSEIDFMDNLIITTGKQSTLVEKLYNTIA